MLVKNLTPFGHATKLTSRHPPRPEMVLVVKGTFALRPEGTLEPLEDQPPLTAERFADEDEERAGECLYPGDFADFKVNAEVMLRGACHAPAGRTLTEAQVRFAVGSFTKTLRVFGARAWTESLIGDAMTEPLPFRSMELSYANAFGGPRYAANPVGRGYQSAEAPSVEHPDEPLRSRSQRPAPATFAPINPAWAPRASRVGHEYGRRYRAERAPYYAEDFDWRYFHAAPPDQQLTGYLRGDERLELDHLHPRWPRVRCRLPGLRLRAFVKEVPGELREPTLRLDTLYVDAERDEVVLLWRGLTPVTEPDFIDVKTVLIAAEPLAEPALPIGHYRALLAEFEADPVGLKELVPEEHRQLLDPSAATSAEEPAPAGDPVSGLLRSKLGQAAPAVQEQVARAMQQLGPLPPEAQPALEQAVARARAPSGVPPLAHCGKPGALPPLGLRRKMRAVLAGVARARGALAGQVVPPELEAKLVALEKLPFDPKLAELDPSYRPPTEPISTEAPGPGRVLSEQDLSGRDLRGVDLRGAQLQDALLTGADLTGVSLVGANLRRAVLYQAKLGQADLTGADLTQANLAGAQASEAILRQATIDMTFFEGAELTGADLSGCRGEYPVFARAALAGAKLEAAHLDHADFTEADLARASLVGASLAGSTFEGCKGRGLDLRMAALAGARFPGADLADARFAGAQGEKTYWAGAQLVRADFSHASLPGGHFPQVAAAEAKFVRADLGRARFYRARLERAEFADANLFGADFSRAVLTSTQFTRANLYEGKFFEAAGSSCDFTGANLKRSTPERP